MTDRGEPVRRPPRAPMARRTRRRWAVAAGVAACWGLMLAETGSVVAGTVLLMFLAAAVAVLVIALRALGVNGAHPWLQSLRSRPWRNGQDVLRLALRHLPEVFVIAPDGSLLAPNSVELWLNPRDFASLAEVMDPGLAGASAAEVYAGEIAAHGARLARPGAADVHVMRDPSVPPGRYRFRQARPVDSGPLFQPEPERLLVPAAAPPAGARPPGPMAWQADGVPAAPRAPRAAAGDWPYARDGHTQHAAAAAGTVSTGPATVAERARPVPVLRLITGGSVAQTRVPGARAGRGAVELALPQVPTVSREHARFSYEDGQWRVENLGRNGLTLNGEPLAGCRPVSDGDSIRWGTAADAPVSRVEIG